MSKKTAAEDTTREKLAGEISVAQWDELRSHALAERMFLLSPKLDLLEVALAVAADDAARVNCWVSDGLLARPLREQMESWQRAGAGSFRFSIVSPFVLTQEICDGEGGTPPTPSADCPRNAFEEDAAEGGVASVGDRDEEGS